MRSTSAPRPPAADAVDARAEFVAAFGYRFKSESLFAQALTHRSFGASHNERLEFLGDGVLDFVIADLLVERFPEADEGDLSRMRAHFVREEMLARKARELRLGPWLRLGAGEARSGGGDRDSILADALEALLGACFRDGGFDAVYRTIAHLFAADIDQIDPEAFGKDAKTRLQEWLQARKFGLPQYRVSAVTGAAHEQSFEVCCEIDRPKITTHGLGRSRRAAEQTAARNALDLLLSQSSK